MIARIANELACAFATIRCPDRVTLADMIAAELAAAEERGRRRGVEERNELRAAVRVALQHLSRVGTEPGFPVYEASKILSAALAPRDSARCPEDDPLCACQRPMDAPRDSGKEGQR